MLFHLQCELCSWIPCQLCVWQCFKWLQASSCCKNLQQIQHGLNVVIFFGVKDTRQCSHDLITFRQMSVAKQMHHFKQAWLTTFTDGRTSAFMHESDESRLMTGSEHFACMITCWWSQSLAHPCVQGWRLWSLTSAASQLLSPATSLQILQSCPQALWTCADKAHNLMPTKLGITQACQDVAGTWWASNHKVRGHQA